MNHKIRLIYILTSLLILFFAVIFIVMISGNPIPVYPDLESIYKDSIDASGLDITWIVLIFVADFCVNILLVYSGIFLLCYFRRIKNRNVFDFSKTVLLASVFIISLVGIISELILGPWIGGLLLALLFIFLSFVLVSKYLLKLSWSNSFIMGLYALLINILVWTLLYII